MIGFLIKKWFFDLWDNLFKIALINLGFIASAAIPVFLPSLLEGFPLLFVAVVIIGILWLFVYLSAAAVSLKAVSDYSNFGFAEFLQNLKTVWPSGLCLGGIAALIWLLVQFVIPFYLGMSTMLGLFLAAVIFWTLVVSVLSFQFFFAVRSRLDIKLIKVIKKSFIFFFDNPALCIFSLIFDVIILVLSAFLAFLFPGPGGLLLFLDEAMRLRLLKYDWLEANPEENTPARRRRIPWEALLIDEREKTGTRSLKSFIFPWKD
jgi:hypothetical protein